MKHYLLLILLITAFISCDSNRVFEENVEIEQGVWNINNPIHFEVQNLDTISEYNFIINVRHACLLYTSPSPRDLSTSRMPSSA